MYLILMTLYIFIVSCGIKPRIHFSDLKKSPENSSEITLFSDGMDFHSSDPMLNSVPPHGKVIHNRVFWFLNDGFCLNNDQNKDF